MVDGEEAMFLLKIKSTTTLQKLRDEEKLDFRNPKEKSFFMTVTQSMNTLKNTFVKLFKP